GSFNTYCVKLHYCAAQFRRCQDVMSPRKEVPPRSERGTSVEYYNTAVVSLKQSTGCCLMSTAVRQATVTDALRFTQ
ncbi:hypothetical protein NDU88_011665, partial [Pleurodeles waltl]